MPQHRNAPSEPAAVRSKLSATSLPFAYANDVCVVPLLSKSPAVCNACKAVRTTCSSKSEWTAYPRPRRQALIHTRLQAPVRGRVPRGRQRL